MEEIRINIPNNEYSIYIGKNCLSYCSNFTNSYSSIFIVTHPFLAWQYGDQLKNSLEEKNYSPNFIFVPTGEKSKSIKEFVKIHRTLAKLNADRKSLLIALGGGVIGDLVGFVASTFLRGIDYYQVPTTLLSQVDSSIGGKTAINIPEGKNLIGSFYHPKAVFIDVKTLDTLPDREFRNGLAEVIKYGIILNEDLFEFLDKNYEKILKRDEKAILHIIKESILCKKYVVEKDEKEKNLRMILNFGHTIGHAIEARGRYSKYLHGECVAIGMYLAVRIAYVLNICSKDTLDRIKNILMKYGFDINSPYKSSALFPYMLRDKKAISKNLRFILPKKIGEVTIEENIPIEIIKDVIDKKEDF
ncbi:MAG: 3-dehydroquinate synthase [Dictyoglomus sp. NZ13-RE01]|nr:MAG: 3-dehydroquinate synthase [Dictyoglomus sp. NZ13-RE01]